MKKALSLGIFFLLVGVSLDAAKIAEVAPSDTLYSQFYNFFSFKENTLRIALIGAMVLGGLCGLMGSFLVVQRKSLFGDALCHAVLPGICLGFLWNMAKDPFLMFVGAMLTGLIATFFIIYVQKKTILREDCALGVALTGFYAVGICLLTKIQKIPSGQQAGLDKYLFGQAAALADGDLVLLGVVGLISVVSIYVFYKEFVLISFDKGYKRNLGKKIVYLEILLSILLASTIIVSLKAVGVILVSAMLIAPGASALLISDNMKVICFIAMLIGVLSGFFGVFFSYLGNQLPTGPLMVLSSISFFVMTVVIGPKGGVLARLWRK